jgi:hypothetical protein
MMMMVMIGTKSLRLLTVTVMLRATQPVEPAPDRKFLGIF